VLETATDADRLAGYDIVIPATAVGLFGQDDLSGLPFPLAPDP
jgi:hypothetical protein